MSGVGSGRETAPAAGSGGDYVTFPLGECYQLMPPLSAAEYEALKADIVAGLP